MWGGIVGDKLWFSFEHGKFVIPVSQVEVLIRQHEFKVQRRDMS